MTSPEDDNLEERLRRALSEAAGEVEPGSDGLDQIRARIGDRRPRPWLFSVLSGVVDRVRNWTWRGHWAWPDSLPGLGALRKRRSRRNNFPRGATRWLRLVTVLAGVGVIAAVTLGVQPIRQAILRGSTSVNGGTPRGGADTEGNGTQANNGSGTPAGGGTQSGGAQARLGSTTTSSRKTPTAAPHPTSSAGCAASLLPVVTSGTSIPAGVTPDAPSTAPAAPVSTVTASPALPTQPSPTTSTVTTCPVTPSTSSPTPTSAASPSSAVPTPTDVSSTPLTMPTAGDPTQRPTASPTGTTETGTETGTASGTSMASPSAHVSSLPTPRHPAHRWHARVRDLHSEWH